MMLHPIKCVLSGPWIVGEVRIHYLSIVIAANGQAFVEFRRVDQETAVETVHAELTCLPYSQACN